MGWRSRDRDRVQGSGYREKETMAQGQKWWAAAGRRLARHAAGALAGGDCRVSADSPGARRPDRPDAGRRRDGGGCVDAAPCVWSGFAPLRVQYGRYIAGVARGDFGQSLRLRDSVGHLVAQRYPYTLSLAFARFGAGNFAGGSGGCLGSDAARSMAGSGCRRRVAGGACRFPTSRSDRF